MRFVSQPFSGIGQVQDLSRRRVDQLPEILIASDADMVQADYRIAESYYWLGPIDIPTICLLEHEDCRGTHTRTLFLPGTTSEAAAASCPDRYPANCWDEFLLAHWEGDPSTRVMGFPEHYPRCGPMRPVRPGLQPTSHGIYVWKWLDQIDIAAIFCAVFSELRRLSEVKSFRHLTVLLDDDFLKGWRRRTEPRTAS